MSAVTVIKDESLGFGFISPQFLPPGMNEYYLRNQQNQKPEGYYRHLTAKEIEILVKNDNTCDNWDHILVSQRFDPHRIAKSEFYGLVRIGALEELSLRHHDLILPAGITSSRIISSDLGDNVAIHNVQYLSHYIIGNDCILFNIDEMNTTDHARFGNGIVKEGEEEGTRYWIDVINETGGRSILPFDGMIPADAYLWATFREDTELMDCFFRFTQESYDLRRGYYGTVGDNTVIKSCRIIKDVKIGPYCYIKGANKLKNLTINSSSEEPTQIGEGVELVNGIIGYGCHVFYGCKAVRFVLCDHSSLKYGARLIHSVLGENSTVSCCEILNNLVFPTHEQHHNNSFLTASLLMGQSNMAAGATIGSNHNSRANDGEVVAGRGFWPGLCVSLKHSSRFASFVLIQKGSYPAELNIPFPFSLVMNNEKEGRLEVMPAYWWLYNMYALQRNAWKFRTRDTRIRKIQHIEFDYLAPDTVEEILDAMALLEEWTGKAYLSVHPEDKESLRTMGRRLLLEENDSLREIPVYGERMENSHRPVLILKPVEAYKAYREMLLYYVVKNLLDHREDSAPPTFDAWVESLNSSTQNRFSPQDRTSPGRENGWYNLGGQLVPGFKVKQLLADIREGRLTSWRDIHQRYDQLWEEYREDKLQHAFDILQILYPEKFDLEVWRTMLKDAEEIQEYIRNGVRKSREKDYENPFRKRIFRNDAEQKAVLGSILDNSFVKQVEEETRQFNERVARAGFGGGFYATK